MSRVSYGAKSGIVAGLFYGIIEGVMGYFSVASQKPVVMALISRTVPPGSPFTSQQLFQAALYGTVVIYIIAGLLIGTFLGVIFALIHGSTPGRSSIMKGMVFGIIIWMIVDTIVILVNFSLGAVYILITLVINLATSMLYGYILGARFSRYMKKERTIDDEIADLLG